MIKNYLSTLFIITICSGLLAMDETSDMQLSIGLMYYYGHGVEENLEEALKWCLKANKLEKSCENNGEKICLFNEIYKDIKNIIINKFEN